MGRSLVPVGPANESGVRRLFEHMCFELEACAADSHIRLGAPAPQPDGTTDFDRDYFETCRIGRAGTVAQVDRMGYLLEKVDQAALSISRMSFAAASPDVENQPCGLPVGRS
jgi:hypothetical protein